MSESANRPAWQAVIVDSEGGLSSWLAAHADALVCAVNGGGTPVPMPPGIPLGPDHHVDQRSVLDLVVPEDSRAVTDAFVDALRKGIGVAKIHMASDDSRRPLLLEYLDLRDDFGIVLRAIIAADDIKTDERPALQVEDLTPVRPRLGVVTKDEVATILSIDEAMELMLGWSSEEMVGRSNLEFIHPDDHVRAIDNWMSGLAGGGGTVRLRYSRKDGGWLWLETSNELQVQEDGSTVVVAQLIDISEEMSAIEALRRNEAFLRRVTDTVPVGLFHIVPDGTVAFLNPVLQGLLGGATVTCLSDLAARTVPADGPMLDSAVSRVMEDGIDEDLDVALPDRRDGARPSCRVNLRAVTDEDQILGVLGCVVDVTELKAMADTDALTGLQNRRSILRTLAIDLSEHGGRVTVVFIDLDRFKTVNDQHGHQVGDELLIAVAGCLRGTVRPVDRVGRLGGDEFLVVCPGLGSKKAAWAVARRLQAGLSGEWHTSQAALSLTASLGVACGERGVTADELVARADAAMYEAKRAVGVGPSISHAHVVGRQQARAR